MTANVHRPTGSANTRMSMAGGQQASLSMSSNMGGLQQKSSFSGFTKMAATFAPKSHGRSNQFMTMSAAQNSSGQPVNSGFGAVQSDISRGPVMGQSSVNSFGFQGISNFRS